MGEQVVFLNLKGEVEKGIKHIVIILLFVIIVDRIIEEIKFVSL
jgi:hypothetical protein